MLLKFKHNMDKFAKDILYALTNRIRDVVAEAQRQVEQMLADITGSK